MASYAAGIWRCGGFTQHAHVVAISRVIFPFLREAVMTLVEVLEKEIVLNRCQRTDIRKYLAVRRVVSALF